MSNAGFYKITLNLETNLYNELSSATDFETIAKGRIGNHLVHVSDRGIPIVRTTTKYNIPANNFSAIHHRIIDGINDTVEGIPALHFNNALIEVYDAGYYKMNYHSDQCLDVADDSYIALFTCYERPDELTDQHTRKLKVKSKASDEEFEYSLTHNSVILFSVTTNTNWLHKIILDAAPNAKSPAVDNKWLGITFRTSKTYLQFKEGIPYFANGTPLELANKEQETEFFKLRGQENRSIDFVYPELGYTLNAADMMVPKGL